MFFGFSNQPKRRGPPVVKHKMQPMNFSGGIGRAMGFGNAGFNHKKNSSINKGDWDRDGVSNMFDCRPMNFRKQDFYYKGKSYPDTVITKQRYSPKAKGNKFTDMRKVNLSIAKKDLDKTTAYYDTIEKVMPGTIDYLKKSKTIVEVGEQSGVFTAAAYLPQGPQRDRGRLYITQPNTSFSGNTKLVVNPTTNHNTRVPDIESDKRQAEWKVKHEVENVAHEMGHIKRDIELGKKGVPAGERFEKSGWANKKYFQKKETDNGYEMESVTAEATGAEIEAEKHKERISKRIQKMEEPLLESYKEEIKEKEKYKPEPKVTRIDYPGEEE